MATPTQLFWHRNYLSFGVLLMAAGGAFHIALVCGYFTAVFPGFARADDLSKIARLQTTMILTSLERDVFEARQQQCRSNDPVAKTLYLQRLNDKLAQYQQASGGKVPRVPECWEFGTQTSAPAAPAAPAAGSNN